MPIQQQAAGGVRALLSAIPSGVLAGAIVGAALVASFVAGEAARAAVVREKAERIGPTAFTLAAYERQADDQRVLVRAARLDPWSAPSEEGWQAAALGERLGRLGAARVHSDALTSARELDCMTQAVYYEARGETPAGQAAVAQVVLNRAANRNFPASICGVVFQGAQDGRGCQFSFACDGSMRKRREPGAWKRARKVAARALDGYVVNELRQATHFHVTSLPPQWGASMIEVAKIGMHVFYRPSGRPYVAPKPQIIEAAVPAAEQTIILAPALVVEPMSEAAVTVEPAPAAAS